MECNGKTMAFLPIRYFPLENSVALGLTAFYDEKYADTVRQNISGDPGIRFRFTPGDVCSVRHAVKADEFGLSFVPPIVIPDYEGQIYFLLKIKKRSNQWPHIWRNESPRASLKISEESDCYSCRNLLFPNNRNMAEIQFNAWMGEKQFGGKIKIRREGDSVRAFLKKIGRLNSVPPNPKPTDLVHSSIRSSIRMLERMREFNRLLDEEENLSTQRLPPLVN